MLPTRPRDVTAHRAGALPRSARLLAGLVVGAASGMIFLANHAGLMLPVGIWSGVISLFALAVGFVIYFLSLPLAGWLVSGIGKSAIALGFVIGVGFSTIILLSMLAFGASLG